MKKNYDLELATFIEKQNVSGVGEIKWDVEFIAAKLYQEVELIELNSYEEVNQFAKALKMRESCYGISDYFNIYTEEDLNRFKSECTDSMLREGKGYLTQLRDYKKYLSKSKLYETWSDKVALAMCVTVRDGSWFSKVCKSKIQRNIISKLGITNTTPSMLSDYYSMYVLEAIQKSIWKQFHTDFTSYVQKGLRTGGLAYKEINYKYKVKSYDNDEDVALLNEISDLIEVPAELGGEDTKKEVVRNLLTKIKDVLTEEEFDICYYNATYTRRELEKEKLSYSKKLAYGSDYENKADYVNSMCGFTGDKVMTPQQLKRKNLAILKKIKRALHTKQNDVSTIHDFAKERKSMQDWERSEKRKVKRHRVQENCNNIYEAEYHKFFGNKGFSEERCALAFEIKNNICSLDDDAYFKLAKLSEEDCKLNSAEILDELQRQGYKAKGKEYEMCL